MQDDLKRELAEFLASKPEWVQRAIQELPPKNLDEAWECFEKHDWLQKLKVEYVQILRQMPDRYKKYEKKIMREYGSTFGPMILGGSKKPGRPRSPEGDEFDALQRSGISYKRIAKSRLPKDKGMERRIESESERIRQLVRRARQRKSNPPDPVQN